MVKRRRNEIDGRRLLQRLDRLVGEARRAVSSAISEGDTLQGDLANVRREQTATYLALAGIQLDEADTPAELRQLTQLDADAAALIAAHETHVADMAEMLDKAVATIADLEDKRTKEAKQRDAALAAYEACVAEVESALETDEAYVALVEALAEAEAVTERAQAKLALAKSDMDEKGAIFRDDPLFMYLWTRGYRTPEYKAGPLTRFLDAWVARLCRYDFSYRNYGRLVELPEWLGEHVEGVSGKEADAESAVVAAEVEALRAAGGDALAGDVETAKTKLAATDSALNAAEAAHLKLAEDNELVLAGEAGPASEARARLAAALKRLAIPDLRVLASQTVTDTDDAQVDQLVLLRKDEMSMELRLEQLADTPHDRRIELDRLEQVRRGLKTKKLDNPYVQFTASAVDDAITKLLSGRLGVEASLRRLTRAMRRRSPPTDPRFGGRDREGTLDLPDAAVGIGLEILKEIGRSSGRGGGFGGTPRARRGRSINRPRPRSGRRSGGFRTGGGF